MWRRLWSQHGPQGTEPQALWRAGLRLMGPSWTRGQTRVPCPGRQPPSPWPAGRPTHTHSCSLVIILRPATEAARFCRSPAWRPWDHVGVRVNSQRVTSASRSQAICPLLGFQTFSPGLLPLCSSPSPHFSSSSQWLLSLHKKVKVAQSCPTLCDPMD